MGPSETPHVPGELREGAAVRSFCADVCRAMSEPIFATAPAKARGWLLIQHPGPWPASGLPADLPAELPKVAALASAAKVRPQLIRRTADRAPVWPIGIYLGSSIGPEPWLEYREVGDRDELAGLTDLLTPGALTAVAAGERVGFGAPVDHQVLLVCAHGSRDPCCAKAGRPMVVALARHYPDLVWETSHVGGDRFAANLVTLPAGSYHGGLEASRAPRVAAATLRGEVDLASYRGRAGRSPAAQAADWYARRQTGLVALDAVEVVAERPAAPGGIVTVLLRVAGQPMSAIVRPAVPPAPRLISCATGEVVAPEHYELVELTSNAPVVPRPSAPATATSAR